MDSFIDRGPMIPLKTEKGLTIYVESLPGEEQVSMSQWEEFIAPIEPVVKSIRDMLGRVKPQKASVEFGIQLGLESGKLTACIVKGSTAANLKIILEWSTNPEEKKTK